MLCCAVLGWVAWDSSLHVAVGKGLAGANGCRIPRQLPCTIGEDWCLILGGLQLFSSSQHWAGDSASYYQSPRRWSRRRSTSPRRTSRWKLFLLPVFVFGFRLLPVDLNKQRLNTQHLNRHLNTDLNKQHLDTDLNKQHLSRDLDEQHLNQHLDEHLNKGMHMHTHTHTLTCQAVFSRRNLWLGH